MKESYQRPKPLIEEVPESVRKMYAEEMRLAVNWCQRARNRKINPVQFTRDWMLGSEAGSSGAISKRKDNSYRVVTQMNVTPEAWLKRALKEVKDNGFLNSYSDLVQIENALELLKGMGYEYSQQYSMHLENSETRKS